MDKGLKRLIAGATSVALVASQTLIGFAYGTSYPTVVEDAFNWARQNEMTDANSIEEFEPYAQLSRGTAAKLFAIFGKDVLGLQPDVTRSCNFSDIDGKWYAKYAIEACQLGLMKGDNGKFYGDRKLFKSEAVVVLARSLAGKTLEWNEAITYAQEKGVTHETDVTKLYRPVLKWELVIMEKRVADQKGTTQQTEEGGEESEEADIGDLLSDLLGGEEEEEQQNEQTTSEGQEEQSEEEQQTEEEGQTEEQNQEEGTGEQQTVEGKVLEVALDPDTPSAMDIPYNAAVVEFTRFDLTAGDNDVKVNSIKVARAGLGSDEDFDKVWLVVDGKRISTDKSINNDDYAEFNNLNLVVKAGETVVVSIMASMDVSAGDTKVNKLGVVEIDADAEVKGLPVWGNEMRTVDYSPASLDVTVKGTDTTVDVGDENVVVGEFKLEESNGNSNKNVVVKSIRLKNNGSASLSDLNNLGLYVDGQKVSTDVYIDGDYVTFVLNDYVIEDGKSKIFEIRADIVEGDDGDTIEFVVKKKFDIYAVEQGSNIGAVINLSSTPLTLHTYTINSGKVKISEDTSNPSSQYVIPDTDNVLVLVAKVDLDQPVRVDSLKVFVSDRNIKSADGDANDNEIDDINETFDNVKLVINDKVIDTVDEITDSDGNGTVDANTDYYYFDSSFELHDNDLIKVYVDVKKEAKPDTYIKLKIDNTSSTDGSSNSLIDVEYISNGNSVDQNDFGGTAESNKLTIRDSSKGVSITRNDGYNNEVMLAGQNQAPLMKFVINAGTESELKVEKLQFNFTFADEADYQDFTNCKLISNGQQVGTTEDVDSANKIVVENINVTIPKSSQQEFELVCDIDTTAADGDGNADTVKVTLSLQREESTTLYDVNDNEVYVDNDGDGIGGEDSSHGNDGDDDVPGDTITIKQNATLTISVDGDTPDEQIIVAGTNDIEVARFKFEATDGDIKIKELLLNDNSNKAANTRVKAYKLFVNGQQVGSAKTPTNRKAYFDLGNEGFVVPKDDNVVLIVKADLNDIDDANQTNEVIQLEIDDIVAETVATSNDLEKVNGNVSIDSDGTDGDLVASNIKAEKMYIRKTQPTLATVELTNTKLQNGEQTIYKVQISADAAEDVEVASIAFDISAKLNGNNLDSVADADGDTRNDTIYVDDDGTAGYGANDSQLTNFKLYVDGQDKTSDLVDGECEAVNANKIVCTFVEGKEQTIAAGASKVFELKATANNVKTDDYVTVQIKEDTGGTADTDNGLALKGGYDANSDGDITDAGDKTYNFIWSDNAGSPHSRTTTDWFNGYKVNGLDTDATTLQN